MASGQLALPPAPTEVWGAPHKAPPPLPPAAAAAASPATSSSSMEVKIDDVAAQVDGLMLAVALVNERCARIWSACVPLRRHGRFVLCQ